MRKSIFFSLLCLIAIVAVACGNGNTPTNGNSTDGDAACGGDDGSNGGGDVWALYKKEGRNWTHKMTGDMTMKTTIKTVAEDHAIQVTEMMGADGAAMGDPTETKIEFVTAEAPADAAPETPESEEKSVEVEAGTFDCISYDGGKTWTMKEYPGVIVKSESMELIEWNE